jgi:hypothetical protein
VKAMICRRRDALKLALVLALIVMAAVVCL